MIISNKNKYIFVSNPKTGTTSIQSYLLSIDDSAKKNIVKIDGEIFSFREHYTASEIKNVLGNNYEDFTVFGVVRNPYEKRVSAYHFLKGNKLFKRGKFSIRLMDFFKVTLANLLPFSLWSLVYPYRSNQKYFVNEHGSILVDEIIFFKDLNNQIIKLSESIVDGYCGNSEGQSLPKKNRSNHNHYKKYYKGFLAKYLSTLWFKRDLEFYYSLKDSSNINRT